MTADRIVERLEREQQHRTTSTTADRIVEQLERRAPVY